MDTSEKSCAKCVHHIGKGGIDSVPMSCWNCAGSKSKPLFEPREDVTVEQLKTVMIPISTDRRVTLDNPKAKPLHQHISDPLTLSAPHILEDAASILKERGQSRDKGDSERSMATVVNIFNAAEGLNLTEEQGWKFMLCLKLGRMKGGKFHFDDYQDLVGYSALLAECAANSQLNKKD